MQYLFRINTKNAGILSPLGLIKFIKYPALIMKMMSKVFNDKLMLGSDYVYVLYML